MRTLKSNSKSTLSFACVCTLISLVALSSLSIRVNAHTQIIFRKKPFDGAGYGWGGDYGYAIAYTTGYHRVYCKKTSWAHATIDVVWTHNKGTFNKVYIQISVKDGYVYKNKPWFSKAKAKFWVRLLDITTTPQVLFDDDSRDYKAVQGLYWYNYGGFSASLRNGRTYRLEAGPLIETGYGWFGYYGTAEARGTIDTIIVDAD